MSESSDISLSQLPQLRRVTRGVADMLEPELKSHFEFLAPILRPKILLGSLVAPKGPPATPAEEAAYEEVKGIYQKVYRPLRLHPDLPKPIPAIRVRIEITAWEELWTPPDGGGKIVVVSPLCWAMSYPGACSLGSLRAMLAGEKPRDDDEIRQFAINSAILSTLLGRNPGFARTMGALRFDVETRHLDTCPELPIPVIRSTVPSVRPPGQVMREAAELAGLSTFEEVIDPAAATQLEDPLAKRLKELMGEHASGA